MQTDQVLTSLQAGTRKNLQILLQQYGTAVKQAGASYNRSIQFWLPAYKYTAIVSHDALGIQPHDLSNWIAAQGPVAAAIDNNPKNLQNLITDFNTTANAFARENVALENSVAALPKTLAAGIPAFNALNAAFPPLRTLAKALIPGVKSTGPMIDASLPLMSQLRQLVQPSELRGLTHDLVPTIPALAKLTKATIPFMKDEVRPASSCVANVVIPWSHLTINDPNFNSKNGFPPHPAYVEAVDFLPGPRRRVARLRRQRSVRPDPRDRWHVDVLAVDPQPAQADRPVARAAAGRAASAAAGRQASAAAAERAV